MKARFIEVIGYSVSISSSWCDTLNRCTDGGCCHYGKIEYGNTESKLEKSGVQESKWKEVVCNTCSLKAPACSDCKSNNVTNTKRYNTDSGKPEPGDLFWDLSYHDYETGKCWLWDNCSGPHLMAVLPNGHHWDIDSRASNCTMKEDKMHRCWVRNNDLSNMHVDKNGLTCGAGAGSIVAGDYHGFLHNGNFTSC